MKKIIFTIFIAFVFIFISINKESKVIFIKNNDIENEENIFLKDENIFIYNETNDNIKINSDNNDNILNLKPNKINEYENGFISEDNNSFSSNINFKDKEIIRLTLNKNCDLTLILKTNKIKKRVGLKINDINILSKNIKFNSFLDDDLTYIVFSIEENDCIEILNNDNWSIEFIENIESRINVIKNYKAKISMKNIKMVIDNKIKKIYGYIDPNYAIVKKIEISNYTDKPEVDSFLNLDIKELTIKENNSSFIIECNNEILNYTNSISYLTDKYGDIVLEDYLDDINMIFKEEINGIRYCDLYTAYQSILFSKYKDYDLNLIIF